MADSTSPKLERDPNEDIEDFLQGAGAVAKKVIVYRVEPGDRKMVCGSIPFEQFTYEEVQRRWGGGDFSLAFYGTSTRDHPGGFIRSVDISVAGAKRDLSSAAPPRGDEIESAAERERRRADEAEAKVRELQRTRDEDRIAAAIQEMKDLIRELREPPPQAAESPLLPMMLELIRNSAARVEPHVATPFADGSSMLGMFRMATEMFTQGIAVGQRSAEGGGEGYESIIRNLGGPLVEYLTKGTNPTAPALSAGQPEEGPVFGHDLKGALGRVVPQLVSWAESGKDPHIRAALLLEDLPPAQRQDLTAMLAEETDPTGKVLGWYRQLAPHRRWMDQLVDSLRFELGLDDDADADTEPAEIRKGLAAPEE